MSNDAIAGAIAGGFAGAFIAALFSYMRQKGENLATKEDIQDITKIVERVKFQNQQLLDNEGYRHQLSMAALEQRLKVHQEAYSRIWDLQGTATEPEGRKVAFECQEWWRNNCLYLEAKSREAFRSAYMAGNIHRILLDSRVAAEKITENYKRITDAYNIIVEGIKLPPITGEDERIAITEKGQIEKAN